MRLVRCSRSAAARRDKTKCAIASVVAELGIGVFSNALTAPALNSGKKNNCGFLNLATISPLKPPRLPLVPSHRI
jgi:hypothetical protein